MQSIYESVRKGFAYRPGAYRSSTALLGALAQFEKRVRGFAPSLTALTASPIPPRSQDATLRHTLKKATKALVEALSTQHPLVADELWVQEALEIQDATGFLERVVLEMIRRETFSYRNIVLELRPGELFFEHNRLQGWLHVASAAVPYAIKVPVDLQASEAIHSLKGASALFRGWRAHLQTLMSSESVEQELHASLQAYRQEVLQTQRGRILAHLKQLSAEDFQMLHQATSGSLLGLWISNSVL